MRHRVFGATIKKVWRRLRMISYRTSCLIDTCVVVENPSNFTGSATSALYHGTYVLNRHGFVELGPRSHLGAYCVVNAEYGRVTIGADTAIGPATSIFSYSNHYGEGQLVSE